jgi:hypothetical protein
MVVPRNTNVKPGVFINRLSTVRIADNSKAKSSLKAIEPDGPGAKGNSARVSKLAETRVKFQTEPKKTPTSNQRSPNNAVDVLIEHGLKLPKEKLQLKSL